MARVSYFQGAETLEDIRVKLIDHLREIDPKSGRFETMIDQYQKACVKIGDNHKSRKGKIYEKRVAIAPSAFASVVQRILALDGVEIRNEGTWFWVSGNTKAHKDELGKINKDLNGKATLRYSGKREAWWFEDKTA